MKKIKNKNRFQNDKKVVDYGSWPSPITADMLAQQGIALSEPRIFNQGIFWLETRPMEGGRSTVVAYKDGASESLIPRKFSARSTVHEYGGASWTIGGSWLFFINQADQRIYRRDLDCRQEPQAITATGSTRYADLQYCDKRQALIAVAEDHADHCDEPQASIQLIDTSPDLSALSEPRVLVKGADFYSSPRISPSGTQLLWLQWNHPDMPWTRTELWSARLTDQDRLSGTRRVAMDAALFQPEWDCKENIIVVSDHNEWWNLYRVRNSEIEQITLFEEECGLPQWQFGMSTWGFLGQEHALVAFTSSGEWRLREINLQTGSSRHISADYNYFNGISGCLTQPHAIVVASGSDRANQVCLYESDIIEPLYSSSTVEWPPGSISKARPIRFQTMDFEICHGFYYPPCNRDYQGQPDSKPPLIVICHGGPTGATSPSLNLKIQFWTSRGFGVADVNYRGSTGYGRRYRLSLNNNWGIHDVNDACAIAEYCVERGWADASKLIIRGGSAGGYTVLSALCFREVFSAGCSLYGIGDLNTLVADTHKFESRYTENLIAPLSDTHTYAERSPINQVDGFNCPIIFFQGMQDKVVLPNQAESMVAALDDANIPVAHVTYKYEAHGFRDAKTITHSLNSELAFYGAVLGFKTDSPIHDLNIHNL